MQRESAPRYGIRAARAPPLLDNGHWLPPGMLSRQSPISSSGARSAVSVSRSAAVNKQCPKPPILSQGGNKLVLGHQRLQPSPPRFRSGPVAMRAFLCLAVLATLCLACAAKKHDKHHSPPVWPAQYKVCVGNGGWCRIELSNRATDMNSVGPGVSYPPHLHHRAGLFQPDGALHRHVPEGQIHVGPSLGL